MEPPAPRAQNARMAKTKSSKKAANNLRAWREHRGLTQDQLAEKVGTAGNVIGLLESGERGLSDKWLRKLAPALGTRPGFLLDHDPNDIDAAFVEEVIEAGKRNKAQVLAVIRALTGTDG